MRRLLGLLSLLSIGVASSTLACSSGISSVAPAADDDSGGTGTDTGSGGTDVGSDTTARDSTATDAVDDGTATDGGGVDGITPGDAIVVDAPTERPCIVTSAGSATECALDEYCDAPTCSSGLCKPRPTSSSEYNPVCGCDGVTYWNPIYAASHGRSTNAAPGACGGGSSVTKTCGGIAGRACPSSTECVNAGASPSTCTITDLSGLCWAIPTTANCIGASGSKKERLCGSGACASRCEATKSGTTFYDDSSC